MNERSYDIQELVAESGTPRRTIHFYTQQAILPPPQGAGLAARYGEEHLLRLRLIPLLRRRGLRLDQIRAEFSRLDAAGMRALLDESPVPLPTPQPTPGPALPAGQASVRYDLGDGIVLYRSGASVAGGAGSPGSHSARRVCPSVSRDAHEWGQSCSGRLRGRWRIIFRRFFPWRFACLILLTNRLF